MRPSLVGAGLLALSFVAGCGDSTTKPPNAALGSDAGDAGTQVQRGPAIIAIDGDPNGLWWDDAAQTLQVADDNGNRILQWTDEGGFSVVKELPTTASPEGAGLGQLVKTDDGALVVTRFGFGTAGDVVSIPSGGEPVIVPGLDVERRRMGLTLTDAGDLYDSWFVRLATGERVGAVGKLELTGTEAEVITGLKKPVGVLAVGTDLYVSDQDLDQILKAPISDPTAFTVFATVDQPDLLATGPQGSLFTGSAGGSLYRIGSDGAAAVFESGFRAVRGVAYDPTNKRIFVADHDPEESDGITHSLHVLPVD